MGRAGPVFPVYGNSCSGPVPQGHKAEDREIQPNSKAMFSNACSLQKHLQGVLKLIAEFHPQSVSFSRSRERLRTCMSSKFPGDTEAAGSGTAL